MELHVNILRKKGKNEFVVLPYEEFLEVQERLADAEDLLELRKAKKKEASAPTKTLRQVKRELGL